MTADRLARVIARIDGINAGDPAGRELPFADRVDAWIRRLIPEPSEALRIAARGQHIRRWAVPRATYPEGRSGYLRWREDLKRRHASEVAAIMTEEGCAGDEIGAVEQIILKRVGASPDAQTMEDALCLVFLESQFEELREKTPDDKMIEILRKTWRKMSPPARQAALGLPLTPGQKDLVDRAVGS